MSISSTTHYQYALVATQIITYYSATTNYHRHHKAASYAKQQTIRAGLINSSALHCYKGISQHYNNADQLHGACRASAGHPGNLSPSSSHDNRIHLVDAILEDHKDIQAYFELYKTSTNSNDKIKWSNQWRWEVARHAIGEELVAYPSMEKNVIGGVTLAKKDCAQHLLVKKHLAQLDGMSVNDPTFDFLMQQTQDALLQHIQQEEENDLPLLRNAISTEEGLRLGSRFELTKSLAPTRSHPIALQKPPFETIASLLAAPIDKIRDMFDQFPSQEEIKHAKGQANFEE